MPLWLASYPRSGNSFLRILLRNRYAIQSLDPDVTLTEPVPRLLGDSSILRPDYAGPNDPVFSVVGCKTHNLPGDDADPAVYVVRDGRDALVSYAHFALTFSYNCPKSQLTPARVRSTIRELILEERSPYGTWAQNVNAWTSRPNTVVVAFENLVANPGPVADQIVAQLGFKLTPISEAIPKFGELKTAKPEDFRRGSTGTWVEVFTPELLALFWAKSGSTMARLGYSNASQRKAA